MSSTQFTPGPWYAFGAAVTDENPSMYKPGTPLNVIACTGDDGHEEQAAEQVANAHLIAAAPELYAALDGLCGMAECWETVDERRNIQLENSDAYKAARSALKKARGE